MSILWCGGEPVDFPVSPSGVHVETNNSVYRPAFARCAISCEKVFNNSDYAKSNPIAGAPFSNVWLSFNMCHGNSNNSTNTGYCGLVDSSKTGMVAPGVWMYQVDNNGTVRLGWMNSGGVMTSLVVSSSAVVTTGVPVKFDIQFTGFGTSSTTIVLYHGGVQFMYWQGDSSGWGLSLDAVAIGWWDHNANNGNWNNSWDASPQMSEIILADESTIPFQGLQTLPVIDSDVTPAWGMTKSSNINKIVPQDSTSASTSTTGNDLQIGIPPMPTGLYQVKATKIAARCLAGPTSTTTNLKLGFVKPMKSLYVQSNYSTSYNTIAFTQPVTSGNLLIVGFLSRSSVNGVTMSDTLGTSYTTFGTYSALSGGSNLILWYGIASSSGINNATFTNPQNNNSRSFCFEFSGASASIDTSNVIYGGSNQTVTITTTQKDLVLVMCLNQSQYGSLNTGNSEESNSYFGSGGFFPIVYFLGSNDATIIGFTVADAATHQFFLSTGQNNDAVIAIAFPVTWASGGTLYLSAAQAVPTTNFGTVEEIYNSDPTNNNLAFGLNLTGYQIDIQSA